jgi:hypothetical protein
MTAISLHWRAERNVSLDASNAVEDEGKKSAIDARASLLAAGMGS